MSSIIPHPRPYLKIALFVVIFLSCYFFFSDFNDIGKADGRPLTYERLGSEISNPKSEATVSMFSRETTLAGKTIHGFTTFDNLYLHNHTYYVVTSTPTDFPPKRNIVAFIRKKDSLVTEETPEGLEDHDEEPSDEELRFITPEEAKHILGDVIIRISGFSVILDDDRYMMQHYYHWWAEIILGIVRVYASLGTPVPPSLAQPARFILPYIRGNGWRDAPGVDGPLMRAAFPNAGIEREDYWEDLEDLLTPVVFERAMVVTRTVAHRHPFGSRWFKMIAGTMELEAPVHFWEPTRRTVVRNMLGYVPEVGKGGAVIPRSRTKPLRPLVAYISRQRGGRRLSDEAHEGLFNALKGLEEEGLCYVQLAEMQNMDLKEQIELVARTTIMLAVHGNGLTHQLWMPPSNYSTVIEIFAPEAYIFDYELPARNLGHLHYAVWNDTLLTYPPGTYHEGISYGGDGVEFSGYAIPVHGPVIANTIRERLAQKN